MNGTDRENLLARFLAKVNKTNTCWLWTGSISQRGYGRVRRGGHVGRIIPAHRYAYALFIGPIPDGLVLDHICRIRHCVNPEHLQPVTDRENVARGIGPTAVNARKTHCKRGHEFNADNTGARAGGRNRYCKACARLTNAKTKASDPDRWRAYAREWARKNRGVRVRRAVEASTRERVA